MWCTDVTKYARRTDVRRKKYTICEQACIARPSKKSLLLRIAEGLNISLSLTNNNEDNNNINNKASSSSAALDTASSLFEDQAGYY